MLLMIRYHFYKNIQIECGKAEGARDMCDSLDRE